MLRNRSELRRQHRNAVQHVLLGAYSIVPHTGNSHVALQGGIPLGWSGVFQLSESSVRFLLQIQLLQSLLHFRRISDAVYLFLPLNHSLELRIGHSEKSGKRLLHDWIWKRAVKLDVSPVIALWSEDVPAEETSVYLPECLLFVGICRFEFPVTGELVHILVGQRKQGNPLFGPLYIQPGTLQVGEKLFVHQRFSGNHRNLTCTNGAPEIGIRLPSNKLGVLGNEVKSAVTGQT